MEQPPSFRKDRHIKYFLRCLKTFLPHHYTSNDANRMTLGFFTIAGLDLLNVLQSNTTPEERQGYIDWVYHCQVPPSANGSGGGFRGFTGTDFGADKRTPENEGWDPANVPATFFALMILIMLGDDLVRVRRGDCLRWLRAMQREDGSFGEVLGCGGKIEGGNDPRFCCCASGVRYILRGRDSKGIPGVEDINVPKLVSYVEACQNYDGGFGEGPLDESHGVAGLSYCAVATLSFLGYTPDAAAQKPKVVSSTTREFERLVRWLVGMQTTEIYDDDDEEDQPSAPDKPTSDAPASFKDASQNRTPSLIPDILPPRTEELQWAGFSGRCNKLADTCYCFWVTGTLDILHRSHLIEATANRRYLLEKTQHMVGGFGKGVGHLPDVMHSYLGLASLALTGESDLEDLDPTFCTSKRARSHLESLPWWVN
ncbi:hypothetical protein FQN54_000720 [Arachnomyces sp. PD_36]|nr:hypothetical protein FQN54_000720 [Arachnomyces sp. PD_36]